MRKSRSLLLLLFIFSVVHNSYSQQVFFTSPQQFDSSALKEFYSSLRMDGDMIYFNANDHQLYAYHKNGQLSWQQPLKWKSDIAPFILKDMIVANAYEQGNAHAILLDKATGKKLKDLPFYDMFTQPIIQNNILYGTGIYDGGVLFAYDLDKDSILWSRFLAHGHSVQPHFLSNEILANAEGHHWVRVNYHGQLMDTTCAEQADIFVQDIPCVDVYVAPGHNGEGIPVKWIDEYGGEATVRTSANHSFILQDGKLTVLKKKLKKKAVIDLNEVVEGWSDYAEILFVDDKYCKLVFNDQFIVYNHEANKIERQDDLGQWQPHQAILDENKIWLVSKKDGRLYGMQL